MTWPVRIVLAGQPRGKGRGRAVSTPYGARVFTDQKTRTYEAQLRYAAQQAMDGRPPTAQPVMVAIEARFEVAASWSRKKRAAALAGHVRPATVPDWENIAKLCDALNGVVWLDDRQVVEGVIRKIYAEAPALIVTVEPVPPPVLPVGSVRVAGGTADLFAGVVCAAVEAMSPDERLAALHEPGRE